MSVSPSTGVLRGNESAQAIWSFAPGKQKTYDHRVSCLLYDPTDEAAAAAAQLPPPIVSSSLQSSTLTPVATTEMSAREDEEDREHEIRDNDGVADAAATDEVAVGAAPSVAPAPPAPLLPPGVDCVKLHVVGEGTTGALAMNPPSLDLGTLPVGHAVTRTVTLLNQSDGVLRYCMDCGPAEGADGDGTREPGSTPVEFPDAGLSTVDAKPGLEVWVDEPEGAIPARASKVVKVTFFPRFRKQYRLQVRCRTSTVAPTPAPLRPPSGGAVGSSAARAVLPPLSTKQRLLNSSGASAAQLSPGGMLTPLPGPGTCPEAVSKWPESTPTICSLSANVVFPRPMVSDVFFEGIPKQVRFRTPPFCSNFKLGRISGLSRIMRYCFGT